MIRYLKGDASFLAGFALLSPWLIAMKLKLISNSDAKQKVMRHFFGRIPLSEFRKSCDDFTRERLPSLIRPKALQQIREHQQKNIQVVVVSASPENLVEPWCRQNQLTCIATRLEIKDNALSGNIEGKNCYGEEKVVRIREQYDITGFKEIYAYGDSNGDKAMLAIATSAHFRPFRD